MKLKLYFVLPFILQATLWRILMRPFFYFFTGFEVRGLENLKNLPKGVIFAPNHSSELDSVLLPLAFPLWSRFSPLFYVVRESAYYRDPYFRWRRYIYGGVIFEALGAFPIVSGVRDYTVSLAHHVKLLQDGASICIFPEGGFSKNGTIGSAHGGVGYLSIVSGLPVVPVYVAGTYNRHWSELFFRRSKIRITFMKPIAAEIHQSQAKNSDNLYRDAAETIMKPIRIAHEMSVNQIHRKASAQEA